MTTTVVLRKGHWRHLHAPWQEFLVRMNSNMRATTIVSEMRGLVGRAPVFRWGSASYKAEAGVSMSPLMSQYSQNKQTSR
eukprot:2542215-Amphidinium_carterae.1